MTDTPISPDPALPADVTALQSLVRSERAARALAEARAASAEAMVAYLKLMIAKLKREHFGPSSERQRRLLDQLELQLEEIEADATQDAVAAEAAASRSGATTAVQGFLRRKPVRKPLPADLPRERIVVPGPSACACCGGTLTKFGEDVTETLEVVPRRWKVVQHVREKFSCRACETIAQAPAPFHVIPRGRAGPGLLAMITHAKYCEHQPLNRQSDSYALEGIDLDVSTLADWVGAVTGVLMPLFELLRRHVLAGARVHGDDTTVPVLAKGRTTTGRLWVYVRDDRPFGGAAAPAAVFFYSADRSGQHPRRHLADYAGILQADAYAGYNELYLPARKPGPITEAACWSHGRRKHFELAELTKAPLAIEAVKRIDDIFAAERAINGHSAEARLAARRQDIKPLVDALEAWMRAERPRLSRHAEAAKAMDYMLKRWPAFTRFLDDGRICLSNNAAERELRTVALGRRSWTFAGSDRGGERAAVIYSMVATCKLSGVDPHAWLADILARIAGHPAGRLDDLLPWNWRGAASKIKAAA